MNIKPHKRYLEDGSNSVRVGQQVAQSDANLAYYSSYPLSPGENIAVKHMHKRIRRSIFDRSNENSDHFVRPSNPAPGVIGGDPDLDNPLQVDDSFPMWPDRNGILHFARERVLRYNDGSRPIYELLNPIVGGNFVLSNVFSDFEKINPIYYSYVARTLVFDSRASFSGSAGMVLDVTNSCSLTVWDSHGKELSKSLYRVFYEKYESNIYKATIFAQVADELTVEYNSAIKKNGGYQPSGKRSKERYIHHPVMKRVDMSPIAKYEYQILGVGETNRRIKVPFPAREIPDKSLHIRWRIQKQKGDQVLTTTWHYDTVGSSLKNVSHDTIKTVFSRFFPGEDTSGIEAIVETIPSGLPFTANTSNGTLRVRSNNSAHEDIFPKPPYSPPTSGSATVNWEARATAKYNLISADDYNKWSVWQNDSLIALVDEAAAENPINGYVPSINSPSEGFKANEDTKWLRFTGSNIRPTVFRTHIYASRYCSIHLGIETLKDDSVDNYIKAYRSHRETVDDDYKNAEVFLDKKDTNSADAYISISPGWNNIWIEAHTPNIVLFETIEVQMNRAFQPWEWQMTAQVNSSYSPWSQKRVGTNTVPYGQRRQLVPNSFKDDIMSNRLCEFQWVSVTPAQGGNYTVEPMDSFKETGAFEIVGIDPNANSSCSEDIIALPRWSEISAQPMQYMPFEDVTVSIQGKGQKWGKLPPPSSSHEDLGGHNISGNGLWRDTIYCRNFFFLLWDSTETLKSPVWDYKQSGDSSVTFRGRNYGSVVGFGKHTRWVDFETQVYVARDVTVPWSWRIKGNWWHSAETEFFVNNSLIDKITYKNSGYRNLNLYLKKGWNKLRIRMDGGAPLNILWIWSWIEVTFNKPFWKAMVDAGMEFEEFIIDSDGGVNMPILDSTLFAEVGGRTYYDPRKDLELNLGLDVFDNQEELFNLEFIGAEINENNQGRVRLHIDELKSDSMKLRVEQLAAEIRPIGNAVTEEIRLEPHPYEDAWHYAYQHGQQGEIKVSHLANLTGIKNIAIDDPDLAKNAFLMIKPARIDDLMNIRVEHNNKMYVWNKRANFEPCIAIFLDDVKSKGSLMNIQLATHLHKLGCSKRYSLMYGDFVGDEIDNEFGRVIIDLDENNNSSDNTATTDEEERRRLMEMNWYVSIDAIGNQTVRIKSLKSLLDTNPIEVHPIFKLYPNLLPFQDYELDLHYSIPEYHYQNLDSSEQGEVKRRIVHKEYPIVLDSRTLKLKNKNIWVPNDIGVTWEGYINVENHDIDYVDIQRGIIHLKTRLSDSERPVVRYYYKDNKLEYRGATTQTGFLHLDLNPGINHSFTQVGNFIPGHLLPGTTQIEETPGPYLLNKSILLYLRPTIITVGEQVLYQGTHGVYHTDLSPEELREYDPLALPIAIINVVPNSSPKDIVLIDTRSRGGGLLEEIEAEIIEQIDPEAESYWDIGNYDGQAYQGNAVAYIRLPKEILKENGGSFDKSDVEEIVHNHIALGVLPIIEYVDRTLIVNPSINPEIPDSLDSSIDATRAIVYGAALLPYLDIKEKVHIDSPAPPARATAKALPVIREDAIVRGIPIARVNAHALVPELEVQEGATMDEIPIARANARALVPELEIKEDQAIAWELPFQLESMQTSVILHDIPGYDPDKHHFEDTDFYGIANDDWTVLGKEVYVEVVFTGTVGASHSDPHPIYIAGYAEYDWDPPNSPDGKVTYDPSIKELWFRHGNIGTRYYKLVRYNDPVDRHHYEP